MEGARHSRFSKSILTEVKEGSVGLRVTGKLGSDTIGQTTASAKGMLINKSVNPQQAMAAMVHEGRHLSDIRQGLIPAKDPTAAETLFAEARAWKSAIDFVKKNDLDETQEWGLRRAPNDRLVDFLNYALELAQPEAEVRRISRMLEQFDPGGL